MRVELSREKPDESGAVRGRLFIDGVFFGYTLENANYIFPTGSYNLYGKKSPKFGTNKVYIDVPGRSNIMFHAGNSINDTTGCVLIGSERDGNRIKGDQSGFLFDAVDMAGANGEPVGLIVKNDNSKTIVSVVIILAAAALFLTKKR